MMKQDGRMCSDEEHNLAKDARTPGVIRLRMVEIQIMRKLSRWTSGGGVKTEQL